MKKHKVNTQENEKLCCLCVYFKRNAFNSPEGQCTAVRQPVFFSKKHGKVIQGQVQIYGHFHCSNGNFRKQ